MLAGCNVSSSVHLEDRPFQLHSLENSSLYLHQRLRVEAGRARVFIQGGVARKGYDINEYATQCNFEIDSVAHQGVDIEVGSYHIERVQALYEEVVLLGPVQIAALRLTMFDGYNDTAAFEGYHFWLNSGRQTQVRRMTCHGVLAEGIDRRPPTLAEIRQTLGALVTLGN